MQLSDDQRIDWLRLIRCEGVGPRTFRGLVNRFGGAGAALAALPDLTRARGKRIVPPSRAEAEAEIAAAARLMARFVALGEADYPRALQATDTAPPLIVIRGEAALLRRPAVAIVGSRNASAAGLAFTERLARGLGEAGLVIVSGLARGIDARAHKAALATGTLAVLAGGQDRIYPVNHGELVAAILDQGGAVVAEMPMGWDPRGRDFPRRNRIISGLSLGSIVVEAARRSGSLITARFALEQGREVFAVPGSPLDPRAEGTNDLIRQGATLVADIDHVLAVLAPLVAGADIAGPDLALDRPDLADAPIFWDETDFDGSALPVPIPSLDDPESEAAEAEASGFAEPEDGRARLIAALSPTPIGTDELSRSTGLSVRVVQTTLLELELDGRIERHGSGAVSLIA
ncbi:DNA-processing protein DprA [Methylobacterium planeticum]|uniref:DNA-protecting protein DprA n=1 Tax=Methylobacterium planeticum TaxID=2615211 RepID=A0A6N6MTE7_9HYPH|nr:DNA-processing protein DprA [Methylobacterium planeticum]KAB1071960.1 DNA-protecting protein DprA [Methylobacterium planeticum]